MMFVMTLISDEFSVSDHMTLKILSAGTPARETVIFDCQRRRYTF